MDIDGNYYRVYGKTTDTFRLANLANDGAISTANDAAFTAGTATKVDMPIPSCIKEAIMLMVGHWTNFQNKSEAGTIISHIPSAVLALMASQKVYRL
jgi:hypothetical protein